MTDFYSKNVKSVEKPLVLAKKIITVFALTVILSLALVTITYEQIQTRLQTKKKR